MEVGGNFYLFVVDYGATVQTVSGGAAGED